MIPPLQSNGNLPPGIHECDWDELVARYSTNSHRQMLIRGLRKALIELKSVGCHTAYIDGSFVTGKDLPRDYDACWEMDEVNVDLLDPFLLEFDNTIYQKAKYRGELFPVDSAATPSGPSFLQHFQRDKDSGEPKGILMLDLRRLNLD